MQGSDQNSTPVPTVPSLRNAFVPEFLETLGERDEPVTAHEAEVAGPWLLEEIPGAGWGLFRAGEGARQFRPYAVFRRRSVALLAAAILPGTGRDPAFRLKPEEEQPSGYAVEADGELAGHLALFDERVVDALHVVETSVRSPESLAYLLEAAGAVALERAGVILARRVASSSR